jgi:hypothetical protein
MGISVKYFLIEYSKKCFKIFNLTVILTAQTCQSNELKYYLKEGKEKVYQADVYY